MDFRSLLGEPIGQNSLQLAELALAFILSASIGLEREIRQKSAGLRTYTLVGFSSALVMLVSKYGFTDILESGRIVLDPSRIAAQIVSGIGFIGGGLIFVRKDIVRGLTTAATVWLTAAVGMACGAGLPILAIAVTFGHFRCGLRVSLDRATPAKIPLGPLVAADFLSGRPRRPSRGACVLHRERVRRQSRAGRAGSDQ
jgi:MgtC family